MRINFFTSRYFEKNVKRGNELTDCLAHNYNNVFFNTINLIQEVSFKGKGPIGRGRHSFRCQTDRVSYSDFFNYINEISCENDINIIANSDITFDNSLQKIIDFAKEKGEATKEYCFAISRDDMLNNKHIRADTQDVWVFFGPIKKDIQNANINLGIAGCDNVIAYELQKAGYKVINPSLSVNCIHNHKIEVRNYMKEGEVLERYKSPPYNYLLVKPQKL